MYQYEKYAQKLPRPLIKFLRNTYLAALDIKDRLQGKADEFTPPRSLHFIGGGDFRTIGDRFVQHFVKVGNLKPTKQFWILAVGWAGWRFR